MYPIQIISKKKEENLRNLKYFGLLSNSASYSTNKARNEYNYHTKFVLVFSSPDRAKDQNP